MLLSFHVLAIMNASIFSVIAAIWMLAPSLFLKAWGVKDSTEVRLVGRRTAALYTGVAVMFFLARHAEQSTARTAMIYGLIITCLMLALLGGYALFHGYANKGILAAVLIELALSLVFIPVI